MASETESEPPITRKANDDESRPLVNSRASSNSSWSNSLQLDNPKLWIAIGITVALLVAVSVDLQMIFPIFSEARFFEHEASKEKKIRLHTSMLRARRCIATHATAGMVNNECNLYC
jgi:hypothetical protein